MKRFLLAAAIILIFGAGQAYAGTTGQSFTVSAFVDIPCSVGATNLNFGTYVSGQVPALPSSATVSVQCANSVSYSVEMDSGLYGGNMNNGGNLLPYSLYQDSGYSVPWGVTANALNGIGTGAVQSPTLYGSIPGGLSPVGGSYSDTVTATIYW